MNLYIFFSTSYAIDLNDLKSDGTSADGYSKTILDSLKLSYIHIMNFIAYPFNSVKISRVNQDHGRP